MTCCNHCRDAEGFFGSGTARRELRRFRKRGPPKSTRLLLEGLRREGVEGATLLDVGGGIGAIQHELFGAGLETAIQVDASTAYLEVAKWTAEEEGHGERTTFVHGDFVELASEVAECDIVTLDRVLCCYPDLDALLDASSGRTRRVLGLVYPRERVGTRVALAIGNLWFRIRRSSFRTYLHPPDRVHGRLREAGLRPELSTRTFLWRVETWVRAGPEASG